MQIENPTTSKTLSEADFKAPIYDRWFEDYQPGAVYEYGSIEITEEELLSFARQFDPQRMHTDPEFASTGPFKGLIASGWHTAAIFMRLYADHYLSRVASLPSPGIDELRWTLPVRPGDALRMRVTIVEARLSKSKPDRGLVRTKCEMLNQEDQIVLTMNAMNFLKLRLTPKP